MPPIMPPASHRDNGLAGHDHLIAGKDRDDEAEFCDRSCNLRHLLLGMGAGHCAQCGINRSSGEHSTVTENDGVMFR